MEEVSNELDTPVDVARRCNQQVLLELSRCLGSQIITIELGMSFQAIYDHFALLRREAKEAKEAANRVRSCMFVVESAGWSQSLWIERFKIHSDYHRPPIGMHPVLADVGDN